MPNEVIERVHFFANATTQGLTFGNRNGTNETLMTVLVNPTTPTMTVTLVLMTNPSNTMMAKMTMLAGGNANVAGVNNPQVDAQNNIYDNNDGKDSDGYADEKRQ